MGEASDIPLPLPRESPPGLGAGIIRPVRPYQLGGFNAINLKPSNDASADILRAQAMGRSIWSLG
jgi:hypothetical protein